MGSQLDKEREQLSQLNFTEVEIKKLHKKFMAIDKDGNGTIEPNEIYDIPELAQNPLVK